MLPLILCVKKTTPLNTKIKVMKNIIKPFNQMANQQKKIRATDAYHSSNSYYNQVKNYLI